MGLTDADLLTCMAFRKMRTFVGQMSLVKQGIRVTTEYRTHLSKFVHLLSIYSFTAIHSPPGSRRSHSAHLGREHDHWLDEKLGSVPQI